VHQVLVDRGPRDWAIVVRIDLAASDELGAPAVQVIGVERR
jgi:hypothetical protein